MQSLYRPLEPTGGHIRLLEILPSKSEYSPISCTLKYRNLSENPVYEALSYTWGRPEPQGSILLNSQNFATFENLEAALRRLRDAKRTRTFWIDALCINQNDDEEKARQVSLMDQIYKNATQVVVWLGEPDNGNRSAIVSLATKNFSIMNNVRIWRAQRKNGIQRGWRDGVTALLAGEVDRGLNSLEPEVGQVAQLLDRPWWRRVWIIQEVVLARKIIIMCGSDEVPWENIKMRLRADGMYGLKTNTGLHRPLRVHNGTAIAGIYHFPDAEYELLDAMQSTWRSGAWKSSLYDLLYQFRRFNCSQPEDRIFGFLGLVTAEQSAGILVDYKIPLAQLYLNAARSLIAAHKHLLILNCKRESYRDNLPYQQTRLYSTLDQGRFVDPHATVIDGPDKKPRAGWIKLPEGWERIVDGDGIWFRDCNTDKKQRESPFNGKAPQSSQTIEQFRHVPSSWRKDWDNLGRIKFTHLPGQSKSQSNPSTKPILLPSWIPNWNSYSVRDPEPLPALSDADSCYWASGKNRSVHFIPTTDLDSSVLGVKGMLFDTIKNIASPWCSEAESLPISRSGVDILKEWEDLALASVENCPYEEQGRENAFWRAHLADYTGDKAALEEDKIFFDAWCDRTGWTPKISDLEHKTLNST